MLNAIIIRSGAAYFYKHRQTPKAFYGMGCIIRTPSIIRDQALDEAENCNIQHRGE
jgi:hypothetical protein